MIDWERRAIIALPDCDAFSVKELRTRLSEWRPRRISGELFLTDWVRAEQENSFFFGEPVQSPI